MRIIAGDFRGRRLHAPRGSRTRPTADRVKEAVFNILGVPERREGAARFRVLDLFAGSGALGLEALSRGADEAVLVEQEAEAARAAERNIVELGVRDQVRLVRRDVGEALRGLDGAFDWVFLDPPYDKPTFKDAPDERKAPRERAGASGPPPSGGRSFSALDRALRLLGGMRLCRGVVIAEHDARTPPSDRYGALALADRRRWGDTAVSFFRPAPATEPASPGEGESP